MIFFYIVSCALLIATVRAQSSTSSTNLDDPYDYYDNSDENRQAEDHRVVEPPLPPTFISKPEKIVVKDGENVTLHCKAADADQYTFMWRRGSESISLGKHVYNPSLYKLLEDNSLFIENVKPLLTGHYSCEIQVSNDLKPTLTHQLKLENDVEILSLKAANNATQLYPGDDLSLTCEAEGNPLPTIKWYFEGDGHSGLIEVQNNKVQTLQRSDVLLIEKVDIKNNGTYQCIADNNKSYDKKSIVIEVFDKGRDVASHTDSRISGGLQLAPSLIVLLITMILTNP